MKQLKKLCFRTILFACLLYIFQPTVIFAEDLPTETTPTIQETRESPEEKPPEPQPSESNPPPEPEKPAEASAENATDIANTVKAPDTSDPAPTPGIIQPTQNAQIQQPTPLSTPKPTLKPTVIAGTPIPMPTMTPAPSPSPIPEPTSTPTASASAIPTPSPTVQTVAVHQKTENTSTTDQTIDTTNSTGSNFVATPDDATITTGTATGTAVIEQQVNTTTTGENTHLDTLNQTTITAAAIDLSSAQPNCPEAPSIVPFNQTTQTQITNTAQIQNSVNLTSDTGQNSLIAHSGTLETSDASATTIISNMANTTLLGNCWYFSAINMFAPQYTDLILPNNELFILSTPPDLNTVHTQQHAQVSITNDATITDIISAETNTGNNSTVATGQITTGATTTNTQIIDTANQTRIGSNWFLLTITNPHYWKGALLGGSYPHYSENDKLHIWWQLPSTLTNLNQLITINNAATITNTVNLQANTGHNSATPLQTGTITTGNAFTSTQIANLANTTAIGDNWYWVMLNLFDNFEGDVVIARPDLIVQAAPGNVQLQPGQSVTIEIVVGNAGQSAAQGITAQINLPSFISSSAGSSWNIARLETGQAQKLTTTLTLDPTFRGTVNIPITVSTNMTELSTTNNQTVLSLTVITPPVVIQQTPPLQTRQLAYVVQQPPVVQRYVQYVRLPQPRRVTHLPKTQQLENKPQILAAAMQSPIPTATPRVTTTKTFCQQLPHLCDPTNWLGTTLATSGIWWWNRKRKPEYKPLHKIYWDEK